MKEELEGKSINDILANLDLSNNAVRNNGGGYYNHCLFWEVMSPNGGGEPTGELAQAINDAYGSFDGFKDAFSSAAKTRFGSDGHGYVMVEKLRFALHRIKTIHYCLVVVEEHRS